MSWDVGGCDKLRCVWKHIYKDVTHFVMVIDSIDYDRILEVRTEIEWFISREELQKVPVLLFANRQDLPNAMTTEYIIETLDLNTVLGILPLGSGELCYFLLHFGGSTTSVPWARTFCNSGGWGDVLCSPLCP